MYRLPVSTGWYANRRWGKKWLPLQESATWYQNSKAPPLENSAPLLCDVQQLFDALRMLRRPGGGETPESYRTWLVNTNKSHCVQSSVHFTIFGEYYITNFFNWLKECILIREKKVIWHVNHVACHKMKGEAPEDKGRAAGGNKQRFGRLYVNRALNHIRIIVIGSLLNLTPYIFSLQ